MVDPRSESELQCPDNQLQPSRTRQELLATVGVMPDLRHSMAARCFSATLIQDTESEWQDTSAAYRRELGAAADGNLREVSRTLMAQALTLDAIFTRMVERAGVNMGEYPEAVRQYMAMALKAQANSRATLEALARIHQPREQIVKHVNVNEGGQAVFANQIHQSGGKAPEDGRPGSEHESAGQPHEPLPALPGQEQAGQSVPVPSDEGKEAMPVARRKVTRGTNRGS